MTKVILSGSASHMGKEVISFCENSCDIQIVAGISRNPDSSLPFPVYSDINEFNGEADVIVDFSHPLKLEMILSFAESRKLPLVLCTTGYSKADEEKIAVTAEKVAILKSSNMSLGVNLCLSSARMQPLYWVRTTTLKLSKSTTGERLILRAAQPLCWPIKLQRAFPTRLYMFMTGTQNAQPEAKTRSAYSL